MYFYLFKCADPTKALAAAKRIVDGYVSGASELGGVELENARSSLRSATPGAWESHLALSGTPSRAGGTSAGRRSSQAPPVERGARRRRTGAGSWRGWRR